MNRELLEMLSAITEEEQEILSGKNTVNRSLYYSSDKKNEIDSTRVLKNGKKIDIRPHTRFIHFPRHTHNYIEFIYMVQGTTRHIIDEQEIILQQGDILFLNQHAIQEIYPAGKTDIAVNFMILPSFFDEVFQMIASEESHIKDFIISGLTDDNQSSNYLYFRSRDIVPVQNLLENLIWNLQRDEPNKRHLNEVTMGLLFLNLINHSDQILVSESSYDEKFVLSVLNYIDTDYRMASLNTFAEHSHISIYTLSRIIKKQTGHTFKQLLESKRLTQACFYLKNTSVPISRIAYNIGYENISFFYRLFRKTYGCTPAEYRKTNRKQEDLLTN